MVEMSLFNLAQAFLALFIILDPFLSIAMFISITKNSSPIQKARDASTAVFIAALLILVFLLLGKGLLEIIGIKFESFMIGGGIIILLLGIKTVLGLGFAQKNTDASIVLIGTPMMSGPGTLTTVILLHSMYGIGVAALAAILVLLVTWVLLIYSHVIEKLLGSKVIEIFSRIVGLIVTAVAVDFIIQGIKLTIGG